MISHRGSLDGIHGASVEGWGATNDGEDEPCDVEILVDNVLIAETAANLYRMDLDNAGIRNGYARFSVALPIYLYDGRPHLLSAIAKKFGTELPGSPVKFQVLPSNIPIFE